MRLLHAFMLILALAGCLALVVRVMDFFMEKTETTVMPAISRLGDPSRFWFFEELKPWIHVVEFALIIGFIFAIVAIFAYTKRRE